MDTTFTFRVDPDLKQSFEACAKSQDRTGSQLLRDFMRSYVKQNAQASLFQAPTTPAKPKPASKRK